MPNYPAKGDKAAANAILDKAGYKRDGNGVRLKAVLDLIPYGEDWRRAGEYLKQAMGDIGIDLELRYEDVPTWLKRIYHNYDFQSSLFRVVFSNQIFVEDGVCLRKFAALL